MVDPTGWGVREWGFSGARCLDSSEIYYDLIARATGDSGVHPE